VDNDEWKESSSTFPKKRMEDQEYLSERLHMVDAQIVWRGIHDQRVLQAMRQVPRHRFVPAEMRPLAYEDCALPISHGQTISQPYIVAQMTSLLKLQGDETVLEIGTGSGYQAAVLACLAQRVVTVEYLPALAMSAREHLEALGVGNVEVICADGSQGYTAAAPYQGILITAAAPAVAKALFEQLTPDGRLVVPVGDRGTQDLQRWTCKRGIWRHESMLPVAFVPLRGEAGWSPVKWPDEY
jgi:protein-L-isoaspartate(D-aspartate) O-methyltransferase